MGRGLLQNAIREPIYHHEDEIFVLQQVTGVRSRIYVPICQKTMFMKNGQVSDVHSTETLLAPSRATRRSAGRQVLQAIPKCGIRCQVRDLVEPI